MPLDATALMGALTHHQAGQLAEAEARYRALLARDPAQPDALFLLGTLLLQAGRAGEALAPLDEALSARPDHAETGMALGNARHRCGDLAGAMAAWRGVLACQPSHAGAASNLAHALLELGEPAAAVQAAQLAIAAAPGSATARTLLARGLLRLNEPAGALSAAHAALTLAPDLPEALLAAGSALRAMQAPAEALPLLRRAAALAPRDAAIRLTLGNVLHALGASAEAEAAMRDALALAPAMAEAAASLGCLLTAAGRLPEAIAACRRAVALRPDLAEAQWNLGIALLLAGDLPAGFAQYEWRKRHPTHGGDFCRLPAEEWQGGPLAGRRLLVLAEQGLGDAVMFARFLPQLAAQGAQVVLACDRRLHPLLGQVVPVVAKDGPLPPHDLWVDQMSLPLRLGTTLASIPRAAGYLLADPGLRAAWQDRLPAGRRLGLVWAGNPAHSNDARRSLPPALLAPLLALPGWQKLSLQVGGRSPVPEGVTDCAPGLADYAETAAVLALCDAVVTVDTSVAHVSGALGRPTHLLLPHAPDWRWLLERADTPWYARMTLHRQPAPGDWTGAIASACAALLRSG